MITRHLKVGVMTARGVGCMSGTLHRQLTSKKSLYSACGMNLLVRCDKIRLYCESKRYSSNDEEARETLKSAIRELSEGQATPMSHPSTGTLEQWSRLPLPDLSTEQLEELGRAYFEGTTNFPGDEVRAVAAWEEAMKRGSIESAYSYAVCLREGRGTTKDTAKAYHIFSSLADSENYPLAHYSVGILLSVGEGCERNDAAAYEHFKAAALGGVTPAIHNMGNAFANGDGVPQSDENALKFYEAGAEAGDPSSKFTLGVWYNKGRGGLPIDERKAFELQHEAAQSGHPLAMFNMGVYYMESTVVEQDFSAAAEWFEKAAKVKFTAAIVNLATMYRTGTGVDKDLQKAREILLQSSEEVCRELLKLVEQEMKDNIRN